MRVTPAPRPHPGHRPGQRGHGLRTALRRGSLAAGVDAGERGAGAQSLSAERSERRVTGPAIGELRTGGPQGCRVSGHGYARSGGVAPPPGRGGAPGGPSRGHGVRGRPLGSSRDGVNAWQARERKFLSVRRRLTCHRAAQENATMRRAVASNLQDGRYGGWERLLRERSCPLKSARSRGRPVSDAAPRSGRHGRCNYGRCSSWVRRARRDDRSRPGPSWP